MHVHTQARGCTIRVRDVRMTVRTEFPHAHAPGKSLRTCSCAHVHPQARRRRAELLAATITQEVVDELDPKGNGCMHTCGNLVLDVEFGVVEFGVERAHAHAQLQVHALSSAQAVCIHMHAFGRLAIALPLLQS